MAREYVARNPGRATWFAFAWLLGGGYFAYSICYMTGFSVTPGPAYAAFLHLPGGLRTHGIIQLCVLVVSLYGILPGLFTDKHGRRLPANVDLVRKCLARVTAVHAGLTATAFALAPLVDGGKPNVGWIPWTFMMCTALILAAIPPTPVVSARGGPGEPR